jgi:hypothetical protein
MKTNVSAERCEVVRRDIGIDRADDHGSKPFRSFVDDLMAHKGY